MQDWRGRITSVRKSPFDRVHLDDGSGKPYCGTTAAERCTKDHLDVMCPFCAALFLADHPEFASAEGPP